MSHKGAWHPAIHVDDLPAGEMTSVKIGETMIAIFNVGGQFYATSNVCTHAFAILTDGWLEDEVIECPLHAGRFDVRTGKALCEPIERDLETFQVKIVDEHVEILLGSKDEQDG